MTEEMLTRGEEINRDLGVAIRWTAKEYVLEFDAKEIITYPPSAVEYQFFDEHGAQQFTPDFDKGERLVAGFIKWDGCSHVNFGDENGYIHLCGRPGFDQLTWTLARVFALAAEHIPHFDHDTAGR